AADLTIRDFRHEIAGMEHGRDFLAAWDTLSTLLALYGVARVVVQAPAALGRLRRAFARFRGASPRLPAKTLRRIESEVDDILRQADEAERAAAGAARSRPPGSTDDAIDTVADPQRAGTTETRGTSSHEPQSRTRERHPDAVLVSRGSTFTEDDVARLINDSNPSFRL